MLWVLSLYSPGHCTTGLHWALW